MKLFSRAFIFVHSACALALGPFCALAQGPWTLQQCIEHAVKNNLQVKQSLLNAELQGQNLLQSKANVLPSVNGNASHSYNFGRTIDPFTNTFATDRVLSQNFYLSSNMTLFSGLQNYNTIRQNQFALEAGKYDAAKTANDVSLSVATAYLQVLFSEELRDNARNQAEVSRQQVERTKKLVEAGSLARGSLLDVEALFATDELAFTNAQNQVDLSYLTLIQLLNLEKAEGFSIQKPTLDEPSGQELLTTPPSQIYTAALSRQPEIKSAEYRLMGSQKGLSVARGAMSPRLSVSGSYGTGYSGASQRFVGPLSYTYAPNGDITSQGDTVYAPFLLNSREVIPFSDQVNDNINKNLGFHLTIPLFNGLQTKTAMSRAKIQVQVSELSLQQAKDQLNKSIQQAYADANAALKKYNASKKAVDAMKESFKYTEQKFNVGILNSNDYSDAKNKLAKAQSDLLTAKYDYIFKVKVLDFYQGKPLTF